MPPLYEVVELGPAACLSLRPATYGGRDDGEEDDADGEEEEALQEGERKANEAEDDEDNPEDGECGALETPFHVGIFPQKSTFCYASPPMQETTIAKREYYS